MSDHARRWNNAPHIDRFRHIMSLQSALGAAINLLSIREQTSASRELLSDWRQLLREPPPQTGE